MKIDRDVGVIGRINIHDSSPILQNEAIIHEILEHNRMESKQYKNQSIDFYNAFRKTNAIEYHESTVLFFALTCVELALKSYLFESCSNKIDCYSHNFQSIFEEINKYSKKSFSDSLIVSLRELEKTVKKSTNIENVSYFSDLKYNIDRNHNVVLKNNEFNTELNDVLMEKIKCIMEKCLKK